MRGREVSESIEGNLCPFSIIFSPSRENSQTCYLEGELLNHPFSFLLYLFLNLTNTAQSCNEDVRFTGVGRYISFKII